MPHVELVLHGVPARRGIRSNGETARQSDLCATIFGMILKACLNGARLPSEHPSLPTTPSELAANAVAAGAAGAEAVHVHVKDAAGIDTLAAEPLAETLAAIRRAARRGLSTRIGLEDTILLPDGQPTPDNRALIEAARNIIQSEVESTRGRT
ncbi:3-keto-5-aminohexanoate cleavage protein [Microbacterium suaedae]|uniref:3-keto-5-aminohexanoate cleavage protein n=1 Tax=Microbacterium suaedae TaxID=2067813 RepID=UPI0018E0AE74|nr:3-keto-5-aminohexanoate cleavage protein [Microbacterium suaedae]